MVDGWFDRVRSPGGAGGYGNDVCHADLLRHVSDSAVDIAAVADRENFDDPLAIVDGIQDSVLSDAQPIVLQAAQLCRSLRPGVALQPKNCLLIRWKVRAGKRFISFSADRLMRTV